MLKHNSNGKISLPPFLSVGFGLILVLALIYFSSQNSDNIPGVQDFAGNIGKKVRLLSEVRTNLFRSEQAEKSAVMADTDAASLVFADQSRRAAESLEHYPRP